TRNGVGREDARRPALANWRSPLVGRGPELASLAAHVRDVASGGGGRLALIVGAPGAGKTRLAVEVGELARSEGAIFLIGRYGRDGTGSFQPWAELLRAGFALSAGPIELGPHADALA